MARPASPGACAGPGGGKASVAVAAFQAAEVERIAAEAETDAVRAAGARADQVRRALECAFLFLNHPCKTRMVCKFACSEAAYCNHSSVFTTHKHVEQTA